MSECSGDEFFEALKPAMEKLNEEVGNVQQSQKDLLDLINSVLEEVGRVGELQPVDVDFDSYLRRLLNAKRRISVMDSNSKGILDRLNRLNRKLQKESSVSQQQQSQSSTASDTK